MGPQALKWVQDRAVVEAVSVAAPALRGPRPPRPCPHGSNLALQLTDTQGRGSGSQEQGSPGPSLVAT